MNKTQLTKGATKMSNIDKVNLEQRIKDIAAGAGLWFDVDGKPVIKHDGPDSPKWYSLIFAFVMVFFNARFDMFPGYEFMRQRSVTNLSQIVENVSQLLEMEVER